MSAQDNDLFSAFAETAVTAQPDSETDEALETLTYIAFLLEGIKSALESSPAAAVGAKSASPSIAASKQESAAGGGSPKPPARNTSRTPKYPGAHRASPVQQAPTDGTKATRDTPTRVTSAVTHQPASRPPSQARTAVSSPQASIITLPSVTPTLPRATEPKKGEHEGAAGKSKSQVQLEEEQQKSTEQKQNGLLDTLKRNLSDWDGTATGGGGEGNLQEAAGLAADGPLFAAVKDIARLVEADDDDKSLIGALRKTVEDKTGITAAKDWAAQTKESLISTIRGWGKGKQEPANPVSTQAGDALRGTQGRFIAKRAGKTKQLPPLATDEEKQQLKFTEALVAGQTKEAKLNEQRHEDVIQALRGKSGGGLIDKAKDAADWLQEKRQGRTEKASRDRQDWRQGKQGRRTGTRSNRRGGLFSKGRLGRLFGASEEPSRASGWRRGGVSPRSGRLGSGLLDKGMDLGSKGIALGGKGIALGTKGLLGAAKMLPVVGQVLAGGMTIMDGFQGWNDAEGQQAAFDLKPDEEATTGQKASYAAASALDMGGLLTGLAQGLGFDLNIGDIAKGLYGAAEFAGSVADTISSSASGIAGSLTDGFFNLTNSIGDKAGKLWTSASSSVGAAMSAVAGSAQGLLDSATATVSETVSAISAKGTELWNSATSALSDAASTTGAAVASAWDSTTKAVSDVAAATKEKATSLLNSSLAWFGFGDAKEDSAKGKSPATAQPSTTPSLLSTTQAPAPVTATAAISATATAERGSPKSESGATAASVTPETTIATSAPKEDTHQSRGTTARIGAGKTVEDVLSEPSEAVIGLFTGLTQSLDALKKTIESSIRGEGNESQFPSVQGMLSGMNSWFKGATSRFNSSGSAGTGGSSARSGGGGSRGTGSVTASRYVYDPNAKIGEAIAKYESGTSGSSAIGYDGTGGTSYGKYQLASKAGSMEGFLKMMEGKGGEHAAIAARLRASGPTNTGSRQGAMPTQWKKEAAANSELMKSAELEYMLKSNYAPAMQGLSGDLRSRVEGSKALQEAMFSTAVQHGPGRTSGIWNKVYKAGMSEEDLTRAVYNERATRFGSSTPQVQESARRRMASEQEVILSMLNAESSPQSVTAVAVPNSPQDQTVQAAASTAIQANTQDAIDRGVGYNYGTKDSQSGVIDCSGWVTEINHNLMESMNASTGQEVYGPEAKRVLSKGADGGAAGIIQAVSGATGELLRNADLSPDKIREGMMIGMDTGSKGQDDAGRFGGIDHIVQTYKDKLTGKMMVSESRGGGKGVMNSDYETWYKKNNRHALYGADVTKLADASKLPALAETAVAAASTPETLLSAAAAESTASTVAAVAPTVPLSQPPAQATLSDSRRVREPEILREPTSPVSNLNFASIETLLAQLIEVVREQKSPADSQERKDRFPDIRVEYDDPYLVQMAHDRA